MQYQIYIENSASLSRGSGLVNKKTIGAILTVIASFIFIACVGTWWSAIPGILSLAAFIWYLRLSLHKKPLLLKVTENEISYFCEEKNEILIIPTSEITAISNSFCKLTISTSSNQIHQINLLNLKSEQTRWEIKEITKSLTKKVRKQAPSLY